MTAEHYAAGKGFSAKTLQWWGGEFARRSRAMPKSKPTLAMARVVRPGETIPDVSEDAPIAIVVAGYQVAVRHGFDAALLRDVLRVLAEER